VSRSKPVYRVCSETAHVYAADGRYVADFESLAEADHFVRAVNAHDALVDVVRRTEALLTRQRWTVPPDVPAKALAPEALLLLDARHMLRELADEGLA
jgi:hypothetical protein